MAFRSLADNFSKIFSELRRSTKITEQELEAVLRKIRIALLEADVDLALMKAIVTTVKERALGQKVTSQISAADAIVKVVHDVIVEFLGDASEKVFDLKGETCAVVVMVGLQGSGKTTTTAKLAHFLRKKRKKAVLCASLDIHRPAAQEQLEIFCKEADIPVLSFDASQDLSTRIKSALRDAQKSGAQVLLLDTAGRTNLENAMMDELRTIIDAAKPQEVCYVSDMSLGQEACRLVKAFDEVVKITRVVLTKADGDARGGSALSMKFVTGKAVDFLGVGETIGALEVFHPDRIARRILGMGDVVTLVEKANENFDSMKMKTMSSKLEKGEFDLLDFGEHLKILGKMGGFQGILNFLPGMGALNTNADAIEDKGRVLKKYQFMIDSMTMKEKKKPAILNASRKRRIAQGSGVSVQEVNNLLKQYENIRQVIKKLSGNMNLKNLSKNGDIMKLFKQTFK